MKRELEDIFSSKPTKENCPNPRTRIIVDSREKNSMIIAHLREKKASIEIKKLEVGDYVIGEITLERKTLNDLIGSLKSNRLKEQLSNLKEIKKRAIIIEENKEEKEFSKLPKNVIQGLILSINLHHQIPIIYSESEKETSEILIQIARKEKRESSINNNKIPKTIEGQKRFILEAFPGIGPKASKTLLENFSSLREIFNSPKEDIEKVTNTKVAQNFEYLLN